MNVQIETRRIQAERSKATALWVIAWCAVLWTVGSIIAFVSVVSLYSRFEYELEQSKRQAQEYMQQIETSVRSSEQFANRH